MTREYHKCAREIGECVGLKKGVKGYHGCAKASNCKKSDRLKVQEVSGKIKKTKAETLMKSIIPVLKNNLKKKIETIKKTNTKTIPKQKMTLEESYDRYVNEYLQKMSDILAEIAKKSGGRTPQVNDEVKELAKDKKSQQNVIYNQLKKQIRELYKSHGKKHPSNYIAKLSEVMNAKFRKIMRYYKGGSDTLDIEGIDTKQNTDKGKIYDIKFMDFAEFKGTYNDKVKYQKELEVFYPNLLEDFNKNYNKIKGMDERLSYLAQKVEAGWRPNKAVAMTRDTFKF